MQENIQYKLHETKQEFNLIKKINKIKSQLQRNKIITEI